MSQQITLHLSDNKTIILKLQEFDAEVDLDDLTKIHYENIYGDIVTTPTLLNKIAQLKAEIDNQYSEMKLNLEIYEANLRKMFKSNKVANGEKYNLSDIDEAVLVDPAFKDRKLGLIRKQKEVDSINSVYWAVKSKDEKLNNLKQNITPKEFETEIIEGTLNAIMIRKHNNVVGKVKEAKVEDVQEVQELLQIEEPKQIGESVQSNKDKIAKMREKLDKMKDKK